MSDLVTEFDNVYSEALAQIRPEALDDEETTAFLKNLRVLSECRPPVAAEPEATPAPSTRAGKLKAAVAGAWDNETTRVLIKAGGAFAGIALVVWSTVHRDHVIQREAMSLATRTVG